MRSIFTCLVTLLVVALALPGGPIEACTSFLVRHPDGPVMAKNFDWAVADGLLVVNPRGLAKSALVDEGERPVRWTSRYGSVSFNQYGREFPMGGMNETGLAMEVLWLDGTTYPEAGNRQTIDPLQWVQYCLDSFRTVSDVVASASDFAINGVADLHFIACEPTGTCAVIEFIDGKPLIRSERALPLPALTNSPYNDSLEYLNRTLGYGGDPVTPEGTGSLARYARAANGAHAVRAGSGSDPVGETFAVLADVAQPDSTQWSIVYELQAGRVHFRSSGNTKTRVVELAKLELDCTAEALILDLMAEGEGDVSLDLVPYTMKANRAVIDAGFTTDRVVAPPEEFIKTMAAYPEKLLCTYDAVGE